MHNDYPTRSEQRESSLYQKAEEGLLQTKDIAYPREIKNLKTKDGFVILEQKPFNDSKALFHITVDWSNAYPKSVPLMVHNYIHHIINTFPRKYVNNLAQELYVIAYRAKNKK